MDIPPSWFSRGISGVRDIKVGIRECSEFKLVRAKDNSPRRKPWEAARSAKPRQGRKTAAPPSSAPFRGRLAALRDPTACAAGNSLRTCWVRSICYRGAVLPDFTGDGELPPGVHATDWQEFQLLIVDEDFEVDGIAAPAQAVFDSVRAKLLFESDVFWARSSIGRELLDLWLDTYRISRSFRKRGIVELELP